MIMEEPNYEKDLDIDPNNLDVEWLRQPQLISNYSRLKADADKHVRELEEEKKTLRSELMLEAWRKGEKLLKVKPTVTSVEAWYRLQPDYISVIDELNDAYHEAEVLEGAVRGLAHKKTALENLVVLLGREYFSAPNAPHDLSKAYEDSKKNLQKAAKDKIKDKKSRRTKN